MTNSEITRRALLRDAAYLGAGAFVLSACTGRGSSGKTPAAGAAAGKAAGAGLPAVEGAEVIIDPAQLPTTFQESPEFAKLVAAGALPPVAERIGQNPLVIKPVHEIGTYGGTIRRAFRGSSDVPAAYWFCAGPDNLLYWDYRQQNIVPNIARDFEWNDDFTELTLHLRRGMKWSDGHPFTADDIIFWREDINLNEALSAPSTALQVRGTNVAVEKVDDFTVRYRSTVPYPMLVDFLAGGVTDVAGQTFAGDRGGGGFAPKHYLSQFHPKYTSEAAANAAAKDAGFDEWPTHLLNQNSWYLNTELPTLTPWTCTRPNTGPRWEFAANPYSIWVDVEGNQLPYIPKISMSETEDSEVQALRAVAGDYDFQSRGLSVTSLPVLIKNETRSDYTIHRAPSESIEAAVRINLAYDKEPEIGELIRTVDFRRALSLGVDRHQVNQTFFLGESKPSATMCSDDSPYFPGREWRTKWATHDVEQANQLLDQIGLSERDDDDFRMLPSGRGRIRLDIQSSGGKADYPAMGEMAKRHWKQIGIDATNNIIDGSLIVERAAANELMIIVNEIPTPDPFLAPDGLLTTETSGTGSMIGYPYALWFQSDGSEGTEPPDSLRELKEGLELYRQGFELPENERIALGKEIFMLHADQVWSIGLVGFGLSFYGLYYAKNNLGNVPGRIINNPYVLKTPSNAHPMTFYYKQS